MRSSFTLLIVASLAFAGLRLQAQQRGGTPQTDKASPVNNGANPFVNYSAQNYHIVNTVSSTMPMNKGTPLGPPYNMDKDGNARGADGRAIRTC